MNQFFPEIKKNFGFGCMRLPMVGDQIDTDQLCKMVDAFLDAGYYYQNISTREGTRAKNCMECGACEGICPQHLSIRELLKDVSATFDK